MIEPAALHNNKPLSSDSSLSLYCRTFYFKTSTPVADRTEPEAKSGPDYRLFLQAVPIDLYCRAGNASVHVDWLYVVDRQLISAVPVSSWCLSGIPAWDWSGPWLYSGWCGSCRLDDRKGTIDGSVIDRDWGLIDWLPTYGVPLLPCVMPWSPCLQTDSTWASWGRPHLRPPPLRTEGRVSPQHSERCGSVESGGGLVLDQVLLNGSWWPENRDTGSWLAGRLTRSSQHMLGLGCCSSLSNMINAWVSKKHPANQRLLKFGFISGCCFWVVGGSIAECQR